MKCSDVKIIELIKQTGQRAEYQAVKCLLKCKAQTIAVLEKKFLREKDEQDSFFNQAMAEFFIKVKKGKFILTGQAKICTYLTEIAKRMWMDFSKKGKKQLVDFPIEENNGEPESDARVQKGLLALSVSDRDILTAFYFYDYSLEDYANSNKISYKAAKKRISRARERLRTILKSK